MIQYQGSYDQVYAIQNIFLLIDSKEVPRSCEMYLQLLKIFCFELRNDNDVCFVKCCLSQSFFYCVHKYESLVTGYTNEISVEGAFVQIYIVMELFPD